MIFSKAASQDTASQRHRIQQVSVTGYSKAASQDTARQRHSKAVLQQDSSVTGKGYSSIKAVSSRLYETV